MGLQNDLDDAAQRLDAQARASLDPETLETMKKIGQSPRFQTYFALATADLNSRGAVGEFVAAEYPPLSTCPACQVDGFCHSPACRVPSAIAALFGVLAVALDSTGRPQVVN